MRYGGGKKREYDRHTKYGWYTTRRVVDGYSDVDEMVRVVYVDD